jgi:hypothetical protein
MDENRFDGWARALAKHHSRRSLLRSTAAAAAVALAAGWRKEAASRTSGSRPRIAPPPPPACPDGTEICDGDCCALGESCCGGTCCPGVCHQDVCCSGDAQPCAGGCCDPGTVCCGSVCCADPSLCSASGARCCPVGTAVCGEDCCASADQCCGGECCPGVCIGDGVCCPAGHRDCRDPDGVLRCVPVDACCRGADACCSDDDCGGEGVCRGTCQPSSRQCEFPDETTFCVESHCSPDQSTVVSSSCDGTGQCVSRDQVCAPYRCESGSCVEACESPADCLSNVCSQDGTCCALADVCLDTSCCPFDPENPGVSCCDNGSCCECYSDRFGNPFCCSGSPYDICRSPDGDISKDQCYSTVRFACRAGALVMNEYLCEGDVVCNRPCCGPGGDLPGVGWCCEEGTECSRGTCVPENRQCRILRSGEISGCNTGERCTTNRICESWEACLAEGFCCPGHRWFSPAMEEGIDLIFCCGDNEENHQSCDGNPFCRLVPDTTCTAIYSFSRR